MTLTTTPRRVSRIATLAATGMLLASAAWLNAPGPGAAQALTRPETSNTLGTSAPATARALAAIAGYPRLAPSADWRQGLPVYGSYLRADGSRASISASRPLRTNLKTVLERPGVVATRAYCIELSRRAIPDEGPYAESPWSAHPPFAANPAKGARIRWILANAWPQVEARELGERAGVVGLTPTEALTATQTAVWAHSDGFRLRGSVAGAASGRRIADVHRWLVAQSTTPELPLEPRLSVHPRSLTAVGGTTSAPFVVASSQPTVTLSLDGPAGVTLLALGDAPRPATAPMTGVSPSGTPVGAEGRRLVVPAGSAVRVRVPYDAGSATITATTRAPLVPQGRVFSFTTPQGVQRQTLISVAGPHKTTLRRKLAVTWTAPPPPVLGTAASDPSDGDQLLGPSGGAVVDRVAYSRAVPGRQYLLRGQVVRRDDLTPAGPLGETSFTAAPGGSGAVLVPLSVTEGHAGRELVVVEDLIDASTGAVVASHRDRNARSQWIEVASPPPSPTTTPPIRTAEPSPSATPPPPHTPVPTPPLPPTVPTSPSTSTTPTVTAPPTTGVPAPTSAAPTSASPSPTTSPEATAPASAEGPTPPTETLAGPGTPDAPTRPGQELAATGDENHRTWPLAAGLMLAGAGLVILGRTGFTARRQ